MPAAGRANKFPTIVLGPALIAAPAFGAAPIVGHRATRVSEVDRALSQLLERGRAETLTAWGVASTLAHQAESGQHRVTVEGLGDARCDVRRRRDGALQPGRPEEDAISGRGLRDLKCPHVWGIRPVASRKQSWRERLTRPAVLFVSSGKAIGSWKRFGT